MNIFARLVLSRFCRPSDAPASPAVAASESPATGLSPRPGGGHPRKTSELLLRSELWHEMHLIGSTLNEFDRVTLVKLTDDLRDRANQLAQHGD